MQKGRWQNEENQGQGNGQLLSVDVEKLAAMLSCGQATAKKIGEEAGARIVIGRRVLYSVSKIQKYIEKMAE